MHHDVSDDEIFTQSDIFDIYRHDRNYKRGGGVLLAINERISSYAVDTSSSLEIIWAACQTTCGNILVDVCYRPPEMSLPFVDDLRESITTAMQKCSTSYVYLLGDFNFPQIDWPCLSSSCKHATDFIELALDLNLSQVINQPTRDITF